MTVWLYTHDQGHVARGYETLSEAMSSAKVTLDEWGPSFVEAIEDADGTAYDVAAIQTYLQQNHPEPAPTPVEPHKEGDYREWNGKRYVIEVDWTADD